ncbi:MAG: cytochrome c3 family protein [Thermoguttaceae bacterium]
MSPFSVYHPIDESIFFSPFAVPDYTSFLSTHSTIPDPPESRILSLVTAIGISTALLALMVYIFIDFSFEIAGSPNYDHTKPVVTEIELINSKSEPESIDQLLAQYRFISPVDQAHIQGNEVTVLCTWNNRSRNPNTKNPLGRIFLHVDDELVSWSSQFGHNTWIARLNLSPGMHKIRTEIGEMTVYIDPLMPESTTLKSSKDSTLTGAASSLFVAHPDISDPNRCQECHEMIDCRDVLERSTQKMEIGAWKGSESCFKCHSIPAFEKKHEHKVVVYDDCTRCHAIHGAAGGMPSLLKAPKRFLCSQCHELP